MESRKNFQIGPMTEKVKQDLKGKMCDLQKIDDTLYICKREGCQKRIQLREGDKITEVVTLCKVILAQEKEKYDMAKRAELELAKRQAQNKPVGALKKAVNFAKASAEHVAKGRKNAPDEIVEKRFAVCKSCPFYIPKTTDSGECSKCGCGLKSVQKDLEEGKNKLRWAEQKCPEGKWMPYVDNDNPGV